MKKSYEFFAQLIQERGLSAYRIAMDAKIPQSAFSLWKNHDVTPKWQRMQRIAEALSTPERPLTAADFYRLDDEQKEGGSYDL